MEILKTIEENISHQIVEKKSKFIADGIINRFSDDGEPSGTAGIPMLSILQGKKMCNILVIVTRYFGGILLGTGGLVRAYSKVTSEALEKGTYIEIEKGKTIKVTFRNRSI